jgi:hypothetical protein
MGVWEDLNWFAIQTKPSREEVAISYLSRLRLEVFCPKTKQNLLLSGRSGLVARPLFPGYLFARFCPASCLRLVQYARGVRRVVSAQDCPLPVDQEIISLIRERVSSGGSIERCAQEFIRRTAWSVRARAWRSRTCRGFTRCDLFPSACAGRKRPPAGSGRTGELRVPRFREVLTCVCTRDGGSLSAPNLRICSPAKGNK